VREVVDNARKISRSSVGAAGRGSAVVRGVGSSSVREVREVACSASSASRTGRQTVVLPGRGVVATRLAARRVRKRRVTVSGLTFHQEAIVAALTHLCTLGWGLNGLLPSSVRSTRIAQARQASALTAMKAMRHSAHRQAATGNSRRSEVVRR